MNNLSPAINSLEMSTEEYIYEADKQYASSVYFAYEIPRVEKLNFLGGSSILAGYTFKHVLEHFVDEEQNLIEAIPLEADDLPTFPTRCLPNWLKDFVENVAHAYQTPVDLPAQLSLAVLAVALAKKYKVSPWNSWSEPLNIFVMVVMRPSEKKSPVFRAVTSCIKDIEDEERAKIQPEIDAAEIKIRTAEAALKGLEAKIAKQPEKRNDYLKLMAEVKEEMPKVPVSPRYIITGDVTLEALGTLLQQHDGRMGIFDSEGGLFDILGGKYQGGKPSFDPILKGWCGDYLDVVRRERSERVKDPALTIALTVQPSVLKDLQLNKHFAGKGLPARFLIALPKSTVGKRIVTPLELNNTLVDRYRKHVERLFSLPLEKDIDDNIVPKTLSFADEALKKFVGFRNILEYSRNDGGLLDDVRDWGGKLDGLILRIAGLLHCAEGHSASEQINKETTEKAIEIGRYLLAHAKAVFDVIGENEGLEKAKKIVSWIKRNHTYGFTRRAVYSDLRRNFGSPEDMNAAFKILIERGWIQEIDTLQTQEGRKPGPAYVVNPLIFIEANQAIPNMQKEEMTETVHEIRETPFDEAELKSDIQQTVHELHNTQKHIAVAGEELR